MNKTSYKNQFKRERYDRLELVVPKGEREKIKQTAETIGMTTNEYIYALVKNDISSGVSKIGEKKKDFTEEQKVILRKWQVGEKYYEMIESFSYSKEDGYFIYLKKGYRNKFTNSRAIQCDKTKEMRKLIPGTYKEGSEESDPSL